MNNTNAYISRLYMLLLLVAVCLSCNQSPRPDASDETPTRGNVKICVDESYQLLIDTELYTFQALYADAKITPQYKPEAEVFRDFLDDSVKAIVAGRKLTKDEESVLLNKSITPRVTTIAFDALAFIINRENKDTLMRFDQVRDIFSGKLSQWNQLYPGSTLGGITVAFDNEKSGNVRYIRERFELGDTFPSYCGAVKTNAEVINYVEKNKNALGIISVNWISDKDDTLSRHFLHRIKVLNIGSPLDADGSGYYYGPYQGNIADRSYPFIREVNIISREFFTGLASGFASFAASDPGQRIVLKSGLVPAQAPIRLIQTRKDF